MNIKRCLCDGAKEGHLCYLNSTVFSGQKASLDLWLLLNLPDQLIEGFGVQNHLAEI